MFGLILLDFGDFLGLMYMCKRDYRYMLKRVRKMACKIAYFRPHGRVPQPCVTHGQVARLCVPCSFQRVTSQVLHGRVRLFRRVHDLVHMCVV